MADEPTRPLVQIDDLIREMTDEELAEYEARPQPPSLHSPSDPA